MFDNKKNRHKHTILSKLEIMADDSDNHNNFFNVIDDGLEWGKSYKLTIEEV